MRPHLLGIDDGPFRKGQAEPVPIVAVMMEGPDLVESVALTRFPVDGADAMRFLADWIARLRLRPTLQGVVLGGIALAGLGVIDISELSSELGLPVLVVTRRPPSDERLIHALRAASLEDRIALVERSPAAVRLPTGPWLACSGIDPELAATWVRGSAGKAKLPEPLRVAHLIAAALVRGESRGRV